MRVSAILQGRLSGVFDEFTGDCLAIDVAGSIRSRCVVESLCKLISERGAPKILRSDNGPAFVSGHVLQWIVDSKIEVALIEPRKPLAKRMTGTDRRGFGAGTDP